MFVGVILVGVVVAAFLAYCIKQFLKHKWLLDKIPGPKSYPLIGNLLELIGAPDVLFKNLHELSTKFYPIFRLKAGEIESAVFIMIPEDIEMLLQSMKHIEKSKLYEPLRVWLGSGLLTSTGKKWQARRKILTPAFHFNILQNFTATLIDHSDQLVRSIEQVVNKPVDAVPLITKSTLHSICETALGTRLGGGSSEEKYVQAVYKMGELVVERVVRPWYHYLFIYIFTSKFWESLKLSKYLHNFAMELIKRRESVFNPKEVENYMQDNYQSKKRLAMLDLLLSAKSNGADIDYEGIREEVDTFMFEGHDTTAMSISFTLMLLACNKPIQDKVYEELKDIFEDSERPITMSDLQEMKYMERVIKESLRLYPSVPMFGRTTSEDMITFSGYEIPKGTNVEVRIYDLHRNANIYPDPEKFDPDRFLPENTKGRHPYAYIPFSAGPRNCIGQKFAILELKIMIAAIIRRFKLEPIDTPNTIKPVMDLVLRSRDGVKIVFRPRFSSNIYY